MADVEEALNELDLENYLLFGTLCGDPERHDVCEQLVVRAILTNELQPPETSSNEQDWYRDGIINDYMTGQSADDLERLWQFVREYAVAHTEEWLT